MVQRYPCPSSPFGNEVMPMRVAYRRPWRWFDDSMLDCCEPLEKVKADGITFGKVACLAHCNGAKVEAFRTSESTIASLFSQGSSQRHQGATVAKAPVEGVCSLNNGTPNISSSYASVVVGHRDYTTGSGVEEKMKSTLGGEKIWSESSLIPARKEYQDRGSRLVRNGVRPKMCLP
ncbi:hypothetical protein CMV_023591 [Castanea mollissima]|uniref:glutathione gamma-glutamylcysteinyltransferase n=1 Tax=Castanea mollissima TaxID=60419 RepID=A0A8J4QKK3_9ROSI|nr:hypothetical protein CMV_023591 [Castanea mollissima]